MTPITRPIDRAQLLKAVGTLVLAVAISFSWLSVGYVLDGPPDLERDEDAIQDALTRTSDGDIEVTAVWAVEEYFAVQDVEPADIGVDPETHHVFVIYLDTHTNELPSVDWTEQAVLRVDGEEYRPVDGERLSGGYHHSTETVSFPKERDGDQVIPDDAAEVSVQIREGALRESRDREISWSNPPLERESAEDEANEHNEVKP